MNLPMNDQSTFDELIHPIRLGPRRMLRRRSGLLLAFALVGIVATADYLSGYEVRLAFIYMLPIALATWTGGMRSGVLISLAATACWGISFQSSHIYSRTIFYYWEGLVLVVTFCIFVFVLNRLRNALARADERFLRVLEGLSAGVYVVDDRSGQVLYANRRLAGMVGMNPMINQAKAFEDRFSIDEISALPAPNAHEMPAMPGHFSSYEARDDQNSRWYLIHSGPIPWENNQAVTLKVITDISAQKQAEQDKRHHQETLRKNAHLAALGEIASTLGHEINQPLMAIASYQEACLLLLAKKQYAKQDVIEALQKCCAQTVRASRIIERARDLLRSRVNRLTCRDINEVVGEAVKSIELDLQDASVSVELELAESLPSIAFDRTLVMQVIINLLQNAIDAMRSVDQRRRRISVMTQAGSDGITVSVTDRGTGMTDSVASMLYTPFFTTKPRGLGLGLCICRSVIEAHAGRLSHDPTPEGGTTFRFTLPPAHLEQ